MPRTVSARLEDELEERYTAAEAEAPEENKSAFLRSVIADGLGAEDRDVLDAIDASDELRAAVETRREEGEAVGDTVRRLLRSGVRLDEKTRDRTPRDRLLTAVGGATIPAATVAAVVYGGFVGGVLAVLLWALVFAFGDAFARAVGGFQASVADLLADEADRNRSR